MGVNIHIKCDGWDAYANGGMKTILFNNNLFPKVYRDDKDEERVFRPTDFALWRKNIVELNCNVTMWLRGLEALEQNPDLWADYSC